jgi:hypothetical protein
MNFTPALPTEPGMYMWKTKEGDKPMFLEVEIGEEENEVIWRGYVDPISKYPGLWSERLEPAKPKCVWNHPWKSGCGVLREGFKQFKFCPFCGGEIAIP